MIPKLIVVFLAISTPTLAKSYATWSTHKDVLNRKPVADPYRETVTPNQKTCLFTCERFQCSMFAYNENTGDCKLYQLHDERRLGQMDSAVGYKVYFKTTSCPIGWISDSKYQMCYLLGNSVVKRSDAWQFCENNHFSYLTTFESQDQRERLYGILKQKKPSVEKWWNGIAMFDNKKWSSSAEELHGYHMTRGICDDNLEFEHRVGISPYECKKLCDYEFAESCVAFEYNLNLQTCNLRSSNCPFPTTDADFVPGNLIYVKLGSNKPYEKLVDTQCNPSKKTLFEKSEANGDPMKCRSLCDVDKCSSYEITNGTCYNAYYCPQYKPLTGSVVYDRYFIKHQKCPFGERYRDLCLVPVSQEINFLSANLLCEKMGGRIGIPSDDRKMEYYHSFITKTNKDLLVDWSPTSGSFWEVRDVPQSEMWQWADGDWSSSTYSIIDQTTIYENSTRNGFLLNGDSVLPVAYFICEVPLGTYPTTCRFTPPGSEFIGNMNVTESGTLCNEWTASDANIITRFPENTPDHRQCRNIDHSVFDDSLWCNKDGTSTPEKCAEVPMCRK